MKRWILLTTWLLTAVAVAEEGQYSALSQRDNDPFVFCTQGMKRPDPCWKPMQPFGHGYWYYTFICDEPNEEGRSWTPEERQGLADYMQVCGIPQSSGAWSGGGSPENSPYSH